MTACVCWNSVVEPCSAVISHWTLSSDWQDNLEEAIPVLHNMVTASSEGEHWPRVFNVQTLVLKITVIIIIIGNVFLMKIYHFIFLHERLCYLLTSYNFLVSKSQEIENWGWMKELKRRMRFFSRSIVIYIKSVNYSSNIATENLIHYLSDTLFYGIKEWGVRSYFHIHAVSMVLFSSLFTFLSSLPSGLWCSTKCQELNVVLSHLSEAVCTV